MTNDGLMSLIIAFGLTHKSSLLQKDSSQVVDSLLSRALSELLALLNNKETSTSDRSNKRKQLLIPLKSHNPYTGLPQDWTIKISKTHNQEYYYNVSTNESQWEPPTDTDLEKLNDYLKKHLHKPTKVRVRHLLIKHKDSRRPASWKDNNITRTKEDAIDKLNSYKDEIERGDATLEQLTYENSDCSSHAKGGDLGLFGKGEMQPSFEKASFGLQVGEMSNVIETDSGVHLIERIG